MRTHVLALALVALPSPALVALPSPALAAEPWRVEVETDPTHLALGGASGWLMAQPPGSDWRFGLGGVSVALPAALLPAGWGLRMNGLLGYAGTSPLASRSGNFGGCYFGYWQDLYTHANAPGVTARVDNVAIIPTLGTRWYPTRGGFYVQPSLGLKLWLTYAGKPVLAGETFPLPVALPIPSLQFGYIF